MTNIYDLDTPTLLVDMEILESNLSKMVKVAKEGGKRLRPHTKTHKIPEIARIQIESGAQGLTVAKLGEAEVMADAGLDDIFIANQLVGPIKLARLMELAKRVKIRVGVDSIEVALPIGESAKLNGIEIPVMMEVDSGLGRAGVRSPEEAALLAEFLHRQPGLKFLGIFTHEGHLYKTQNQSAAVVAAQVANRMREVAQYIENSGVPCEVVSVGSTPGAKLLAPEPGLTEMRPGVYVFNDRSQLTRGGSQDDCALTVLATVISVRSDGKIIVDAGTKSLASDCPFEDKTYGEILGHPEIKFVGASEEHGHLFCEGVVTLKVGDKVRIIPNHACTCVNMHDTLTASRGEQVETVWQIAGRGKIK